MKDKVVAKINNVYNETRSIYKKLGMLSNGMFSMVDSPEEFNISESASLRDLKGYLLLAKDELKYFKKIIKLLE